MNKLPAPEHEFPDRTGWYIRMRFGVEEVTVAVPWLVGLPPTVVIVAG